MSRIMNAGPPEFHGLRQPRSNERFGAVVPQPRAASDPPNAAGPGPRTRNESAAATAGTGATGPATNEPARPGTDHGDGAFDGDAEATLVRDVDLRGPLPDIPGGSVTRVWLIMRVGGVAVGRLLIGVPEEGLCGAQVGAAIAARLGSGRRHLPGRRDGQARSRSRGRISSL